MLIDNITIATGPLHSSHFLNGFPALKVEHLHCDTVTQLLIGVNEVPEGGRGWRSGRERVEKREGDPLEGKVDLDRIRPLRKLLRWV